jgi:hypothetical protein
VEVTRGLLTNWIVTDESTCGEIDVQRYIYQSQIATGAMAFTPIGRARLATLVYQTLGPGRPVRLAANDVHTTAVRAREWAAWLVTEGASERPASQSGRCYSTQDLTQLDARGLYQPMTRDSLRYLLTQALPGAYLDREI